MNCGILSKNTAFSTNLVQIDDILILDTIRLSLATSEVISSDELLVSVIPGHELIRREGGKPDLRRPDGIIAPCSITHTPGFSAICWGDHGQIGIDAERVDRVVHPGLSARMHHPDDDIRLLNEPLLTWIIKESVLKCIGTGLRLGMNKISARYQSSDSFVAHWNTHAFHGILLSRHDIRLSLVHTTSIL